MKEGSEALGRESRRPALHLRVSRAAEARVRAGHPWVYSDSVRAVNRAGRDGELAVIYDRDDRFLAVGLFDAASPIRVRILHRGRPRDLDEGWFREALQRAVSTRAGVFQSDTTGYRWINGESDGWPALVLDRYGSTCVLKLYSLAWLPWLSQLQSLLLGQLAPERLVLRLSRNIHQTAAERFGRIDGSVLHGPPVTTLPTFLESGLTFEADVVRGQKTGFFLDQRENRRQIERWAAGRRVLNAFSFSGGFSLYAARGGARSVTDIDISRHALESARRNVDLNTADPNVARCAQERIQADVFQWLHEGGNDAFDLIVLDPPSLARRESERTRALQAYQRLAGDAVARLSKGGILFAASCSAHVTAEDFFGVVRRAAGRSRRRFTEIGRTGHAADHPATFPEAQYLKGIFLKFEDPPPRGARPARRSAGGEPGW